MRFGISKMAFRTHRSIFEVLKMVLSGDLRVKICKNCPRKVQISQPRLGFLGARITKAAHSETVTSFVTTAHCYTLRGIAMKMTGKSCRACDSVRCGAMSCYP